MPTIERAAASVRAAAAVPAFDPEGDLHVFFARRPLRSGWLYRGLLALVLLGAAALPLVRVPVTVRSAGLVRPAAEKADVRARTGGVIRVVHVQPGTTVRAGQVVAELDAEAFETRARALDDQIARRRLEETDLRALIARRVTDPGGSAPLTLRLPQYAQEAARLRAELRELEVNEMHQMRQLDAARELRAQNFAPETEVQNLEVTLQQTKGRRAALLERTLAAWHLELATVERDLRALEASRATLATEFSHASIRAPVSGTIDEFGTLVPGGVVAAGERVAVVSPDTVLRAEIMVSSRDVGLLRAGMPVVLQVDAFPFTKWGSIPAAVVGIGDDMLPVNGAPTYRVICALSRTSLRLANGAEGRLRKGMTVAARFVVAERSLWQLLFDDVGDWVDPRRIATADDAAGGRT